MSVQREPCPNIPEKLRILWCQWKHSAAMWPIHGRYACRICGRSYRVPWAQEHLAGPTGLAGHVVDCEA